MPHLQWVCCNIYPVPSEVHTPTVEYVDMRGGGGLWSLSDSSAENEDQGGGVGTGGEGGGSGKFRYPFSSNHRTQPEAPAGSKGTSSQENISTSPLRGIDMSGIIVPVDESSIVEEIPQRTRDDESLRDLQQQLDK